MTLTGAVSRRGHRNAHRCQMRDRPADAESRPNVPLEQSSSSASDRRVDIAIHDNAIGREPRAKQFKPTPQK